MPDAGHGSRAVGTRRRSVTTDGYWTAVDCLAVVFAGLVVVTAAAGALPAPRASCTSPATAVARAE